MGHVRTAILMLTILCLGLLLQGCGGKGTAKRSPLADEIVGTAHKYLGVPYEYGGRSPSGFDCSGLVWYVFREHGIKLPDSSYKQAAVGEKIDKNELQPGDLVFFQSDGRVGHVGLYIGDGTMIHAPGRGKRVRKASLSDTYYKTHYATARRLM